MNNTVLHSQSPPPRSNSMGQAMESYRLNLRAFLGLVLPMTILSLVPVPVLVPARCQGYKTFFASSLMTRPNKLECLTLETLSSQVLEFKGKA
jgi:hypothetical protein